MEFKRLIVVVLCLSVALPLHAGFFGETDAEKEAKIATHVADLMREPNKLIAQAQDATEAGDLEEAIRLFSQAQAEFEKIETKEDTSNPAFATMRLKKFHCVSMLDALALKRSEVMDVRQAVTDTSDLEVRLAQEREAIMQEEKKTNPTTTLPTPPTWKDQLATKQTEKRELQTSLTAAQQAFNNLDITISETEQAFRDAARAHSAADAAVIVARTQNGDLETAMATLKTCKETLEQKREALTNVKQSRGQLEQEILTTQKALDKVQAEIGVIRREIATEDAALAAKKARADAEQKRLEADALLKQQAAAREAEKERAKQQQAVQEEAKAKADAEALKNEIAWCNELWRLKRIEALEQRVTQAAMKWNSPELMVLLARIRMVQGRYDDALELAAVIPSEGEPGLQARMVAAGVYLTKNKPFEAMKVLEETLKDYPNDPTPWFNMAVTLLRLPEIDPKRDLSARHYERSIRLGGKRSSTIERRLNME